MPKKRLLHIQLLPLLSGVQNMMLELVNNLDRNEYEIYIMSKPGGPLVEAVKEAGYTYIPVSTLRRSFSIGDFASFWLMYRIIKRYRFDIVHTHSSKTGFLGRIAARLAGVPKVIHTVHGYAMHAHQPRLANIFYTNLERLATLFCHRLIFVNNYERQFAIRKGITSSRKSRTIYNTVDLERFKPRAEYWQKHRHLAKQPLLIGSVLRFMPQKNTINTILAAIKVCHRREDVSFIFLGDGDEYIHCKEMVEKENLNMRILLTGWQEKIEKHLPRLDVFLLYSRWEGLPISILEAMACGLPVVCSDIKGNNELVGPENGILVEIDNESALVEALSSLPDRISELINWSRASRNKVEKSFSLESFVKAYREEYEH